MTKQQSITPLSAKVGRSLLVLDQWVTKVTGPQTGGESKKHPL